MDHLAWGSSRQAKHSFSCLPYGTKTYDFLPHLIFDLSHWEILSYSDALQSKVLERDVTQPNLFYSYSHRFLDVAFVPAHPRIKSVQALLQITAV